MNAVRWGIIGCGDVTEKKSGPAFGKVPNSHIAAVMRRDAAKAADYARRHNVPAWYADAQQLIDDPHVNAVYVATPPGSHCEYALRVAAAGKPCYVEKPMARNHDECRQMISAFAAKNLPLFVAYYRRCLPRFLKTRDILVSNEIGELVAIEYSFSNNACIRRQSPPPWRLVPEHSGGGLFLDLASHLLDLLDFLLGPLTLTFSEARRFGAYDVEDLVVVNFVTPNQTRGVATWDFAADEREDLLTLEGTRGKLELSCFGDEPLRLETASGSQTFSLPNPEHVQLPLIETIVAELLGHPTLKCPSTGESAARTQAFMDVALTPYYGTRVSGFWNTPTTWPGAHRF